MLAHILAAAGPLDTMKEIGQQFGWEPRLFMSQVILFVIVAILLAKFAFKPLLAMLEQRRQTIAESLKNAEKIKTELARAEASRQEIMTAANNQANKLIEEARAAASKVLETETQKAISTAEQIIAKAREAAEADRLRMMGELRREIGRLVVETSIKVTGKILTVEDQKRLADDTNRQLAA